VVSLPVIHTHIQEIPVGSIPLGNADQFRRDNEWLLQYSKSTPDEQFEFREWFSSIDQTKSGFIDAAGLKPSLEAGGDKFSSATIDNLVLMFSVNSKTINFQEFCSLFKYIKLIRLAFESASRRKSGYLDLNEVTFALHQAQFVLMPFAIKRLFSKFDKNHRNSLSFENFMELCISLSNLKNIFHRMDINRTGTVTIDVNAFLDIFSSA